MPLGVFNSNLGAITPVFVPSALIAKNRLEKLRYEVTSRSAGTLRNLTECDTRKSSDATTQRDLIHPAGGDTVAYIRGVRARQMTQLERKAE